MIHTRKIVFACDASFLNRKRLEKHPGVEFYVVEGADPENVIDMGLLNDLHSPLLLAFVGGEAAKNFADLYEGQWLPDSETVNEDLLRLWGLAVDPPKDS